jgi:hypothetical protein|tara:strand:- start:267 stop:377 length:111 start_codon:yes stop_codon:yes gene_type:complete
MARAMVDGGLILEDVGTTTGGIGLGIVVGWTGMSSR